MASAYAGRRVWPARTVTSAMVWRRLLLAGILGLALAVRFREPLFSPIIGAEDPYIHMARTWSLFEGNYPSGYPPGFTFLLAPFAILGPEAFYAAARFLPPFLGVVEVLGVYLLCRENLRTPAALVAATCVALMPENVIRTNLLFPTALDLALIPFFLLHLLRALRGHRRALWWCAGIAVVLALTHPWVVVFLLPPTLTVAFLALRRERDRKLGIAGAGLVALAALVFLFLPETWNPAPSFLQHAGPRAWELVTDPASIMPLPLYVDSFPGMVTWSVLALAGVGVLVALARRTTLGLVALVYSLSIVPFVFVDWFDIWFIPHRSVAYLSIGLALLAALPIELMGVMPEWNMGDVAAAFVVVPYLVLVLTPGAWAAEPWYRLYEEEDYEAWREIADTGTSLVITGSWQSAAGYRAITGEPAIFNPQFLRDEGTREHDLESHPDIVVLIDDFSRDDGFKAPGGWREIGRWGDSVAYRPSG